jgi:hypothetical protein
MDTHVFSNNAGRSDARPVNILRWTFHLANQTLACDIRTTGSQSCAVCVVPFWNPKAATVENFNQPSGALRRHAEIAWRLRGAGWILDRGSAGRTIDNAA